MEAHDGFMMCRSFHRLRARVLLLKQDKLTCLESQLDQIDQDEPLPLFLGKSRGDTNSERKSVLSQIESAIADYGMLVMYSINSRLMINRLLYRENSPGP